MLLLQLLGTLLALLATFYTVTFALSEFRRGNPIGGVGVGVLALATTALPVYYLFMRS